MSSALLAKKCCCGPGEPAGDNCQFRWTMIAHHTASLVDIQCNLDEALCTTEYQVEDPAVEHNGQKACYYMGDPPASEIIHWFPLPKAWRTGCCIGLDIPTGPVITDVLDGVPGYSLNPIGPPYTYTPYTPPSVHCVGGVYATGVVFTAAPWNSNYASRCIVLDVCIPGIGGPPFYAPADWHSSEFDPARSPTQGCVVRLYYGQPVGTPQPDEFRLAKIEIGSPQGFNCPNIIPGGAFRSIVAPFTDDPDYAAIGSPPLVLPFGTC